MMYSPELILFLSGNEKHSVAAFLAVGSSAHWGLDDCNAVNISWGKVAELGATILSPSNKY